VWLKPNLHVTEVATGTVIASMIVALDMSEVVGNTNFANN